MGTNQQLTTDEKMILKLIYDIEKMQEYIKERDNDDSIMEKKQELVTYCLEGIANDNIMNKPKKTSENDTTDEEHKRQIKYEYSKYEDCLKTLGLYGYIENGFDLTLEGKKQALLYVDELKRKKQETSERRRDMIIENIKRVLGIAGNILFG